MASRFFSPYQQSLNNELSSVAQSAMQVANLVGQVSRPDKSSYDFSLPGSLTSYRKDLRYNNAALSSVMRSLFSVLSFVG